MQLGQWWRTHFRRHEAGQPATLNLCICNAWCNMLMWFLASCGQTRPDLEAKARWSQQIAWTGLCCVSPGLWMMGSLPGWQVIIHSLGVPHPSLDTTPPAGKMVRVEGRAHSLGAHILITRPLPLFHYPLQENRFLLAAQLPRVTSHDRNETWGATDRGLSQVQGQTKSHMPRMRRWY